MSTAIAEFGMQTRWLHFQRPRPALKDLSPAELLTRSAELAGNLRYGSDGREVVLLGEVRVPVADDGSPKLETEPNEVPRQVGAEQLADANFDEVVAAALEQAGYAWKRREQAWVLPAGGRLLREVAITPEDGGLRVQVILMQWDGAGAEEIEAVARLLCRAQLGLRFCRAELGTGRAALVALVQTQHADEALADSVGAVAAGCRFLAREVAALLVPETAKAFLQIVQGEQ